MSTWTKIWLIFTSVTVISSNWFYPYLWDDSYHHLRAIAWVGAFRTMYLLSKGKWSIVPFVMCMAALNNLFDELFFDPLERDWNEWTGFLLIILIATIQRKKWIRK